MTLPGDFRLTTEVTPYFTSGYFYSIGYDDIQPRAAGYWRLDARLTLETPDKHWAFDVIGKNLTDRVIIDSAAAGLATKESPLNVAGQVRYQW